jgi:HNH endonuclease
MLESVRFWSKVAIKGPDECWNWLASTSSKGYGRFAATCGKNRNAHVVAFENAIGPTKGLFVCHSCDNPPCCNPAHLWLGTNSDNQKDSYRKNRKPLPPSVGEANGNAFLNEALVRGIRFCIQHGDTNTAIGSVLGVHHSTISLIRRGLSWNSVAK